MEVEGSEPPLQDDEPLQEPSEDPMPYNLTEDRRYRYELFLIYIVSFVSLLCLGILALIFLGYPERVIKPQCDIQVDLLIVVALTTLLALCIMFLGINLLKIAYFLYDMYLKLLAIILLLLHLYPLGVFVLVWINSRQCQASMPLLIKIVYWMLVSILGLPSLFCLIFGIFVVVSYFLGVFDNGYTKKVKAHRQFQRRLSLLLKKYIADPENTPKPDTIYKDYKLNDPHWDVTYSYQEKSQENAILFLYFSRLYSSVTINSYPDAVIKSKLDPLPSFENLDLNGSQLPSLISEPSDTIFPVKRTSQYSDSECPICSSAFTSRSLIIKSPCCNQLYHRSCIFALLPVNQNCTICGNDIYRAMRCVAGHMQDDDSKTVQMMPIGRFDDN